MCSSIASLMQKVFDDQSCLRVVRVARPELHVASVVQIDHAIIFYDDGTLAAIMSPTSTRCGQEWLLPAVDVMCFVLDSIHSEKNNASGIVSYAE